MSDHSQIQAAAGASPTELYRHWDFDGKLLYIGISANAMKRLAQHLNTSRWRDQLAKMTTELYPTRGAALDAEAAAILAERPPFNRAGRKPPVRLHFDTAVEMAKFEQAFPQLECSA